MRSNFFNCTILDPQFKRIHFNSPITVSNATSQISNDIRSEYRRREQCSSHVKFHRVASEQANESSIWCRHEKLLNLSTATQEIPSSGSVPNELKQYLDQPVLERKSDPIKFWVNCRHFTPVLSEISLKYLICQAPSILSERVASVVNLTLPDNRSRLTTIELLLTEQPTDHHQAPENKRRMAQIYLLSAAPSKSVTAVFRIHLNLLNGPLLAFLFPETASRKPAQVNLNHMLCPAILDPFDGPWYRVAAVLHQAVLCPALCKLYCLIADYCLTRFPPTKVKPNMKDILDQLADKHVD
ncbi:Transmembrane protein 164 [Eumeta japonica]|uniref:Transmembrane protein 164 n=1 Tax=Eumeta variegata TaxID=151549 RepID=A0A4C1YCW3_EUMVA|nr:Transmembrane protein 164 [Eumeta japonica]